MRKDSTIVGGITLFLTAAILGCAWYMAHRQAAVPATPEETTWTTLEPGSAGVGGARTVRDVPAETSAGRSERIIECDLPDGSKAFTNAASCAEADFNNRLSIAQPLGSSPMPRPYSGEGYQPPAQQARSSTTNQKPNLRLTGTSPPSGLNVACTFAVGKALELERALSAAKDPNESVWREDYCEWRCEAIKEDCGVDDSYFYYRYQQLCREEYLDGC